MKLKNLSVKNLFHLYANVMRELRERKILRSFNNPVGDYAEYIIANKLNLELTPNSNKEFDAIDRKTGTKYQIKSRRLTQFNKSRQLGVLRNLDSARFNFLMAIIFDEEFNVLETYKIPKNVIKKYARFSKHQNGYILTLRDNVLKDGRVIKINL